MRGDRVSTCFAPADASDDRGIGDSPSFFLSRDDPITPSPAMNLAGYDVDDAIPLPVRRDRGIGIVGCGGIVNYAHLPAYQASGFRVVACHDRDLTAAERTAADHHIPRVAATLDDLLVDDDVEIVDIAVTPEAQVAIAERAAATGKHLLCQKPLAPDYPAAARLVATAREAGVKLAVNQQMRW